ncbi:MAG: hypothetical protein Q4G16_00715 [Cruoricaptor ignavus]|nr:hypothetical protein [Cruoricaptor ignavus]
MAEKSIEKIVEKIKVAEKPLGEKRLSKFSIKAEFEKKEEEEQESRVLPSEEDLPNHHFTDTDLQTEWRIFVENTRKKDIVVYNAISSFKLSKTDEDTIQIKYPSDTAKAEFDKVQADFFNHFKHKVNHFKIQINYVMDENMKKEVVTKKTLFDKMVKKNSVLKELDDLLKFDFS